MSKRTNNATVAMIASQAGVSKATVDRVVNDRPGVQAHTRDHVLAVQRQLASGGGPATGTAKVSATVKSVQIDFLIPDHDNAFLVEQARQIEHYAASLEGVTAHIHRPVSAAENALIDCIQQVTPASQGIGIIGVDTARVRQSLRQWTARNIPIVTLASDIRNTGRSAYIGIDNYAAGRLAGFLCGKLTGKPAGKTAIILGLRAYLGHEEREMGFRSVMREKFPALEIVAEREIEEDERRAHQAVEDLLKSHPGLDGIYCIGSGQTGVAKAIKASSNPHGIVFIGHGLTEQTRGFLIDGTMDAVIDESAADEARMAVDHLVAAARELNPQPPKPAAIHAIFAENIPV